MKNTDSESLLNATESGVRENDNNNHDSDLEITPNDSTNATSLRNITTIGQFRQQPASELSDLFTPKNVALFAGGISVFVIIIFFIVIIQVYETSSMNSRIIQLNSQINMQNKIIEKMSLTTLGDGKLTLDINVDAIRLPKPHSYIISETITNSVRLWSTKGMKVYVGDSVTWNWITNENIAECDVNGNLLPKSTTSMHSGPLVLQGSYTYKFNSEGIRYFTSENTQTMHGVIVVVNQPSISLDSEHTGPYQSIRTGIQTDMTTSTLSEMDGCWRSCYDSSFGDSFTNSFANACSNKTTEGNDWIFAATYDPKTPSKFIVGGFAKKSMFARSFLSNTCPAWTGETITNGYFENGIYWYSGRCVYQGVWVFGFSSTAPIKLAYTYNYANCPSPANTDSTSWSSEAGCVGTKSGSTNSAWTSRFKRTLYINTCKLLVPPY